MSIDNVISIIISILGSSVITLILSTFIFQPLQDKKKYVFEEKKRVYESIIVFAQIVLFPAEARFSLGVARYNIQELSDDENKNNAINKGYNDRKFTKSEINAAAQNYWIFSY